MKSRNCFLYFLILSVLIVVALGTTPVPAVAAESTVCIPSCSSTDSRMLSVASVNYETLAGQTITLRIAAPGTMSSFQIGIFDGDTSGEWDAGTTPLIYILYADPLRDGEGLIQIDQWLGSSMTDNVWTDITITQDVRAMAPSGHYFYQVKINLPDAGTVTTLSNFKIRSNAPIELAVGESFAYSAVALKMADLRIIYPQYPALTPTTYDGTWDLYVNVPVSASDFRVYDGDMDFGTFDCSLNDTDDPDTPNDALPVWAIGISDSLEGVATSPQQCKDSAGNVITGAEGQVYTTGSPADDHVSPIFQRPSSPTYEVTDPNGNTYHNENPSGNREWEQFRIEFDPTIPADYHVNSLLPAGLYHMRVSGMDLANLNAWHFNYDQVCVYEDGTPCIPLLHPYKIGDAVWNDANGNGVQDTGEAGIPGVTVTLLDSNGNPLPNATTITDASGNYSFGVDAGTYSVRIDSSNFEAGGALAGFYPTTSGGNIQTNTVTTDNVLTYDFGYNRFAAIGSFVWNDWNGNGIQDVSEPGVAGVMVKLLGSDGTTVVGSTTTDAAGNYSFTNVLPGTYYVQFVAPLQTAFTTANAGSDDAKDSDADATGKTAAIILSAGETNDSIDAGIAPPASIGNLVWKDLNSNGIQDDGEPGMAGIAVKLLSSDGTSIISSTVTDSTGNYSFTGLLPGTYYVQFVAPSQANFTTVNAGGDDAKDSDANITTGKTGAITLSAGETNDSVDAGLAPGAAIGNFVWNDLNGNGIQNDGEPGMAGVTVNLLGGDGTSVIASTTTNATGYYNFSDLLPGTYYIQFVAPSQTNFTLANAGGDDTKDSDADAITGKTAAITLNVGETNDAVDAGLKEWLSLSCPGNLVRNPSFELNRGSPPRYWTNGTAGPINVPAVDGLNVAYIKGSGTMYQRVDVTPGNSYTLTFYSGSHIPSKQTVKIQYFTMRGSALGSASTHIITSDLEETGFGGPYSLTLGAAPAKAAYLKIMVSANNYDWAKVDKLCLQTGTPPATASIGDFVWNDLNSNGIQDGGEAGMAGITVKLLGSDGTSMIASTTTDVTGNYNFTGLLPGTYYVQFVAPTGATFTTANVGGDDARDSDANTSGKTAAITLSVGETNNTVDAGLKESLSLSCPGNLVLNPSFELNTGTPPLYWTNGTAGPINVPVVDGKNAGYITGSKTMYQGVNVTTGNAYTLTFYSGSHNPWQQTVRLQYYSSGGSAVGTAALHTITSDLEETGFGGPYSLMLGAAPSEATSLKIMVSANGYDYAKVDMFCLQAKPVVQINYCGYIRSPGFWKNYAKHMTDAAFQDLISHTQDFSYLTVQQALTILSTNKGVTNIGIPALDGVDASYLKFLLSSELNAIWNGQESTAAPGGILGTGNYQGMTVNQVLHQAYVDRTHFSADQKAYLEYLGANGENADQNACLVQP